MSHSQLCSAVAVDSWVAEGRYYAQCDCLLEDGAAVAGGAGLWAARVIGVYWDPSLQHLDHTVKMEGEGLLKDSKYSETHVCSSHSE